MIQRGSSGGKSQQLKKQKPKDDKQSPKTRRKMHHLTAERGWHTSHDDQSDASQRAFCGSGCTVGAVWSHSHCFLWFCSPFGALCICKRFHATFARSQRTESAQPSDYSLPGSPLGSCSPLHASFWRPRRNEVTVNTNTGKVPEGLVSMAAWAEPAHPRAPQGTVSPSWSSLHGSGLPSCFF